MKNTPQRFPLSWPAHRPRRSPSGRKYGQFKKDGRHINAAEAMIRVERELEMLGGRYPLLSSNLELRIDGRPRADRGEPLDRGVCLYFELKSEPFALACETYNSVAQNIAAIAAHLEATRAIERHGVATAAESLRAFTALPPPNAGPPPPAPWFEVLGLPENLVDLMSPTIARSAIEAAFREVAKASHPDRGGSKEAMADVNRAREEALKLFEGAVV